MGLIIVLLIMAPVIVMIRDCLLKTNEVTIRVVETWYCFKDDLWYKCQYKKKGAILWIDFVTYINSRAKVDTETEKDPKTFNKFKHFDYKKCEEYNELAYKTKKRKINERNRNICTILK